MSKLPYEIVDKIIGYYDDLQAIDTHKNAYRQVMDKINIQSVLIEHESIMSTYILGWNSNLYTLHDYERRLSICNKCKCCISHQTYRPNINNVRDGSHFKTIYNINNKKGNRNYTYSCSCKCRAISRMLCVLIDSKLNNNCDDEDDSLYEGEDEDDDFI